ncbi:MAG: hypothetical protein ACLFS8_04310, partial [Clostridia bacterium]
MTDTNDPIPSKLARADTMEILPHIPTWHHARRAIFGAELDAEIVARSPDALAVRVADSSMAHTPEIHTWWDNHRAGEALLDRVSAHTERPILISVSESLPSPSAAPGREIPELGEILMFRETTHCPIPRCPPLRSDGHPEGIVESGAYAR